MIDIEALAKFRAKAESQSEEAWLHVSEMAAAEITCRYLTDGEIEWLYHMAEDPEILRVMFEGLANGYQNGEKMALTKLRKTFVKMKLKPEQGARLWKQLWTQDQDFSFCLKGIQRPKIVKPGSKKKVAGKSGTPRKRA